MNETFVFSVTPRTLLGKKVSKLRREKMLPANISGVGKDSVPVQCVTSDFVRLFTKAGETSVVYLQVEGDSTQKPVLIDEIQTNPLTGEYLHVSFKQVDLTQKIEAEVPIEVVGEFNVAGAVLVTVRDHIVVEALPTDLPEKFEVHVETLKEVGQTITLADLVFDKNKITLVEVEADEDWNEPLVIVQEQREEEVEAPVVTPQDVQVTGEAKPEAEAEAGKDTAKAE